MGQAEGSDIAFHFHSKIGEKIILKSFQKGSWKQEETVSNNPFSKGAGFIMIFAISSEGYEVYFSLQFLIYTYLSCSTYTSYKL